MRLDWEKAAYQRLFKLADTLEIWLLLKLCTIRIVLKSCAINTNHSNQKSSDGDNLEMMR